VPGCYPEEHLTGRLPFPLFARSMIGIGGIVLQVGRMSRGGGHEVWRKSRVAKSSSTTRRLLGLLLEEGDKVCGIMISWMSGVACKMIIGLPLRSLAFLRPPKAILVPGMYFLGFCIDCQHLSPRWLVHWYHKPRGTRKGCPPSTQHPCPCWRRCKRSRRPGQTCGRRDRGAQGRSCCPRRPSGCGTVRSGS
jgi:hypothetical protein